MRILYDRWSPVENPNSNKEFPALDEIQNIFSRLGKEYEEFFDSFSIGKSVGGRSISCAILTDKKVPDETKSNVVLCGCEHGTEKNSATTLLKLVSWLLESNEGRLLLKEEKIIIIPVINGDGYEELSFTNMNGVNLFADYYFDAPPTQPESKALFEILENFSPELFVSMHGVWQDDRFRGIESTNVAFTSNQCRCFSRVLAEIANNAAEEAGYPQDRGEEDSERILATIETEPYHSFAAFNAVQSTSVTHAYCKYHSLSMTMEVKFEESGFVRLKSMLKAGIKFWRGYKDIGFPCDIISRSANMFLCASGNNKAELRNNRVKLWNNNYAFTLFSAVPEMNGLFFGGVVSGKGLRDELHGLGDEPYRTPASVSNLAKWAEEKFAIDTSDVSSLLKRLVYQDIAPHFECGTPDKFLELSTPVPGCSIKLRLPYNSKAEKIWLSGKLLKEGEYNLKHEQATGISWLEFPVFRENTPALQLILVEYK